MDSPTTALQRDLIFISYSHQDKQWLDRLQILLKPFVRDKQISLWIDPYIQVGDRWERKIDEALNRTKIAVLLVSPHFLASDFIADVELPAILNATERGDAVLFCVPISSVPKSPTLMKLSKYQWARGTEEPLGLIPDEEIRNNALVKIVDTLVTAVPFPVAPIPFVNEKQTRIGQKGQVNMSAAVASITKQMGRLYGVPAQRPHFISRPEELNRLKVALLTENKTVVGISGAASKFGLHGQGGIGKSVLAIALANDDEVRQAFPDGIYWITLGQAPDMLRLLDGLIQDLTGKETDLTGVEPCKKLLRELFEGKCCLLVLDDLWRYEDALAFDTLNAGSKLLITTRDATLLTAIGAHEERLDRVKKELALELLAQWSAQSRASLPHVAEEIAEHCSRIPLALALAGARVRDGMAWDDLRSALARGHLEFLDHPYGSIFKSMRCSVDALPNDWRQRYLELAIFPEDTVIPEPTVHKLWHQTGGLDAIQVKSLLKTLERKGLVYTGQNQREAGLSFHDLQQDFLRLIAEDLPSLHAQFLQAYRDSLANGVTAQQSPWSRLPADDRYIWSYLAHHLTEAECSDELHAVVQDLHYLAKKIFLLKVFSAESDLVTAERMKSNAAIEALRRNLAQSGHVLTGFSQMDDLLRTLYTRLRDDPALASIADRFESSADISFLKPLWPMPDRPHSALLRTLEGHTGGVTCCAVDPQGKWIVSGADDGTLRLWDVASGHVLRTLEGHTDWVHVLCGRSAGQVDSLRRQRSYTAPLGCRLRPRPPYPRRPHRRVRCAVDPQGKWIVSGANDRTLRLWDVASGHVLRTLEGHTDGVTCCAVDPQGKWIVSGAGDGTLRLWDVASPNSILVIRVDDYPSHIACFPSGTGIVASGGKGLYLFELKPGMRPTDGKR
ncbi:MAG: NB-ARC domain-containing protein [Nitrospira sp.]|nr:NB-ARC domain-containing protein [Nitrospira sp.]